MPLFASTVVTWGGLSLPPSNRPAETTTAGSSRSAIRAPSRASAVGERQMFAVQTTRISIARAYRTGRAGRAVAQHAHSKRPTLGERIRTSAVQVG
jgi:hypothetical protein